MNKFEEIGDTKTKITIGKRQTGKTTELIKRAAREDLYILTANKRMADCIFKQAKEMGFDIRYPITIDKFYTCRLYNFKDFQRNGILIDEGVLLLKQLLHNIPIREIALTDDDNIEYLYKQEEKDILTTSEDLAEYQNEVINVTHNAVMSVYEKLDDFVFQTICDFDIRDYDMKVDKKELAEAFALIRNCKENGVDISQLIKDGEGMNAELKRAYESGRKDALRMMHDRLTGIEG